MKVTGEAKSPLSAKKYFLPFYFQFDGATPKSRNMEIPRKPEFPTISEYYQSKFNCKKINCTCVRLFGIKTIIHTYKRKTFRLQGYCSTHIQTLVSQFPPLLMQPTKKRCQSCLDKHTYPDLHCYEKKKPRQIFSTI